MISYWRGMLTCKACDYLWQALCPIETREIECPWCQNLVTVPQRVFSWEHKASEHFTAQANRRIAGEKVRAALDASVTRKQRAGRIQNSDD